MQDPKPATPALPELHDIAAAFSLLTRLPVPVDHARAGARGVRAGWAYPVVGLVLGGLAGAVTAAAIALGLPPVFAAACYLGLLAVLTGGLHEDGLADCADGLGGGRDRAHALEIMKDSRVGAFGVIAIGVTLLARVGLVESISGPALIWAGAMAGAVSRFMMLITMAALPPARKDGLSAGTGRPTAPTIVTGAAVVALAWLASPFGATALIAVLAGILLLVSLLWIMAMRRIRGQTGDVLGATQQLAEIGALAGFVITAL